MLFFWGAVVLLRLLRRVELLKRFFLQGAWSNGRLLGPATLLVPPPHLVYSATITPATHRFLIADI
jgi:hypothetical protein